MKLGISLKGQFEVKLHKVWRKKKKKGKKKPNRKTEHGVTKAPQKRRLPGPVTLSHPKPFGICKEKNCQTYLPLAREVDVAWALPEAATGDLNGPEEWRRPGARGGSLHGS